MAITELQAIEDSGVRQWRHPDKCTKLRALLESPQLEFAMEAHNGISARIVEQAGFKALWASGLAISAQFSVRDNNEASWTQVVDMLEFMSDATSIPILLDGDTGYGNFNNMRRLVHKLEQRGIAGVCIEDKQYPKTNSFIAGERQPLADVEEFCGKIKAGKDSQMDPDFSIVARVEALIAGWGLDEALRRAEAYHEAGADAILIHSKRTDPAEVLDFAKEWAQRLPLVIVPTKYYSTPTEVFRKAGVSLVIWANHMIRAAIAAMEAVAREVQATESLVEVEDRIAPLAEVFRLQGADELVRAEQRYARRAESHPHAVVLAASRGHELQELTVDRPKVMLPVAGRPLLRRLVGEFNKQAIHDVTVVAGYKAESIDAQGIKLVTNPEYATTGELMSLTHAQGAFADDMVILYGDLLFRSHVLRDLLERDGELVAVVDSALSGAHISGSTDYAYCSAPDDRSLFQQDVQLLEVRGTQTAERTPSGRWIGMLRVRGKGRCWLEEGLAELRPRHDFAHLGMPELMNHLIASGRPIKVHYIHGHWLDINRLEDLDRAGSFARGHTQIHGSSP
jgi:phosphoenolpyruvate phosphomutase